MNLSDCEVKFEKPSAANSRLSALVRVVRNADGRAKRHGRIGVNRCGTNQSKRDSDEQNCFSHGQQFATAHIRQNKRATVVPVSEKSRYSQPL
jgi:hypothetical protein